MAEFMLQRTGAAQTVPVYLAFLERFPTLERAFSANDIDLQEILAPLGRAGRYKQLRQALKALVEDHDRLVPCDEKKLLELPGIGPYTARAILVFAFNKSYGLFDPNIGRVLSRAFGIKSKKSRPHTDKEMWIAVDRLVSKRKPKEFNWALLDLGRTVCTIREPKCGVCPMQSICNRYSGNAAGRH
ncbi:MAG: A/G-specific adenine glycosylase [Nitrospira sp.]|nr:MAG: A/G-specific adenine glycosylase [Nitrospira sp.]